MKEVKIQIPDNCELVKDGVATIQEKNQNPPRSWEEFCERYPMQNNECFITSRSNIASREDYNYDFNRHYLEGRNWCISREEAKAFLALIQLRQLRKAWVGDWEQTDSNTYIAAIVHNVNIRKVVVKTGNYWSNITLSFPTPEMAEDFLSCFKDLCETAKNLL